MDIKSGIQEVKQELSGDEKILEQAFHLERLFKKYKTPLIALGVVAVVAFAGYKINGYLQNIKLQKANSALLVLQKDPKNAKALATLKADNKDLYALFSYSEAANSANKKALQNVPKSTPLLKDMIDYHISVLNRDPKKSLYYKNLVLVEKAYLLIQQNKKEEAKNILIQIPRNSRVAGVARLLEHLTINK